MNISTDLHREKREPLGGAVVTNTFLLFIEAPSNGTSWSYFYSLMALTGRSQ